MKRLLFIALVLAMVTAPAQATPSAMDRTDLNIIVEIGQSNESGYGALPSTRPVAPNAWNLNDRYQFGQVQEPNDHQTAYPVDAVNYDPNAKYGPTLAMVLHLHSYAPDYPVLVVTCAKGNTSITQWQKAFPETTLYGACDKRLRVALRYGRIVAFVMHQGEYETFPGREDQALAWAANFTQLVSDLRSDYGDVPIVFGQIGINASLTAYPYQNVVMEQQASVDISGVLMYTTSDLATGSDGVHFTAASYNQVGCRQADRLAILLGFGDGLLPCVF